MRRWRSVGEDECLGKTAPGDVGERRDVANLVVCICGILEANQ